MTSFLTTVLEAHGGLARWNRFSTMTAHLAQGGALWALKGKAGLLDAVDVTVGLRDEWASHAPFGSDGRRSRFTPDRISIEDAAGRTIEDLIDPRASFQAHTLETPWSDPQLAYFAGCAMWTYLNMPFLLAYPGVETQEIEPWRDGETVWRRLRAAFAPGIATHSRIQTLYVDADNLIARHDYDVEIAGSTPGAHFLSDYVDVSGIKVPTRRRIFPRRPDGRPMPEPLVVSIDLSAITLS